MDAITYTDIEEMKQKLKDMDCKPKTVKSNKQARLFTNNDTA